MLRNKAYNGYYFRIVVELMVLAIFLLSGIGIVHAEIISLPETQLPDALQMPGRLEANGTHFELKNSGYSNITLDSSEPINLTIESPPKMVTMRLESLSCATTTKIIMRGFAPKTTYQKYQDDYHNLLTFTTDDSGSYAYTQDLSKPHFVFIQPEPGKVSKTSAVAIAADPLPSTIFIRDDATGGDCTLIGTWDNSTKTCILTMDSTSNIQIDNSNIIFDGNGHTVTGNDAGFGIYLTGKMDVTIKNLNVRNFSGGIYLYDADSNNIINNTVSNNYDGIYLGGMPFPSTNNNFIGNNASKNIYGIHLDMINMQNNLVGNNASNNIYGIYFRLSSYNSLTGNTMAGNKYNFYIFTNNIFSDDIYHNIDTSNLVDGKPIYYVRNAVDQVYDASTNAGTFFCINCDNVTIKGLALTKNGVGVVLWKTNNSRIENIRAEDNVNGIYLGESGNNNLTGNNASDNGDRGIYLMYSNNNDLTANNASNNIYAGIDIDHSNNNNLAGNTANSNDDGYGISLSYSNNDNLTGNYASDNGNGISFYGSTSNITVMSNIMSCNRWNFGIFLADNYLDNNIDTSNLVDGKPIYYVKNAVDQVYDASTNAGTFFCINCDNVTIKGLALTKNGAGVFLWKTNNSRIENIQATDNAYGVDIEYSNNNHLTGSTASNNFQGIYIEYSNNNDLTVNNVSNNEYYGIIVGISNNNLIYNNYFNNSYGLHHPINAVDYGNNIWNITKNNGTNIIGGSWLGGNYWSDYAGNDTDGDALGDTMLPYNSSGGITNGGDYLPLIVTPALTASSISGFKIKDTNGNGKWDAGEAGIQGWNIALKNVTTGEVIASNLTDTNGFYKFTNLADGRYNVTEEIRTGFTPTNATFMLVNVAGQNVMNLNFTNQPLGPDLIKNPGFESGTSPWIFFTNGKGKFIAAPPGQEGSKSANIVLYTGGTNIQLYQTGISLEPKTRYRLTFAANSTKGHDLKIILIKHISPFTSYGLDQTFNLNMSWQEFSTEFTTTGFTGMVNDGRLMFHLAPFAAAGDTYYIDNVQLEKVTGTLSVTTTPASGDIYVDSVMKGTGSWSGLVSVGSHIVSFGPVSGYLTPSMQTVEVYEDLNTLATAIYNITNKTNIINNSGFESGTTSWQFYGYGIFTAVSPGYEGSKSAKIALYAAGNNIQVYQRGIMLEPNTNYSLSFAAYSTTGHDLKVLLFKHVSPYTCYGLDQTFNLGKDWQEFSTEFTTTGFSGTVNDGRLMFYLVPFAKAGDTYYFDNVQLEKI